VPEEQVRAAEERPGRQPQERWWLIVASALIALGFAAAAWVWLVAPHGRVPPPTTGVTGAGKPAYDFILPVLSPRAQSPRLLGLRSLRGSPVVLNFWASWCAPCRAETPLLADLSKTYTPRGVVFVGVDIEDDIPDAREFIGQYHVGYAIVHASDDKLIAAYGLRGLPTTVFIGPDGTVRDEEAGGFIGPEGRKALIAQLDSLLHASAP
jgi:cytochrome c biogenesis protein CcmG, thiol:disulfide interchange protein DsbE